MTPPGNGTGGPADGDGPGAGAAPAPRPRRVLPVLVAVAAIIGVIGVAGVVAVRVAHGRGGTDLLDADAPALADFTFHSTRACTFEPDRGGLVAHFDLSTHETGRFTVDLEAVTDEGADDLDVATTHAVRVTVPFYAGQTRKQLDVVVPVSRAEYERGYRKCRYTVNPDGAD